jgi:hypothetical protein
VALVGRQHTWRRGSRLHRLSSCRILQQKGAGHCLRCCFGMSRESLGGPGALQAWDKPLPVRLSWRRPRGRRLAGRALRGFQSAPSMLHAPCTHRCLWSLCGLDQPSVCTQFCTHLAGSSPESVFETAWNPFRCSRFDQSGRQDSSLRPSASKELTGGWLYLAFLVIARDLGGADLPCPACLRTFCAHLAHIWPMLVLAAPVTHAVCPF